MTQNLDDSILILTMSGEHGCLFILVGGGGYRKVWTCRRSSVTRSSKIALSRVCLLHCVRRTVLILCGKTIMWGIFESKRPKTHMPLHILSSPSRNMKESIDRETRIRQDNHGLGGGWKNRKDTISRILNFRQVEIPSFVRSREISSITANVFEAAPPPQGKRSVAPR